VGKPIKRRRDNAVSVLRDQPRELAAGHALRQPLTKVLFRRFLAR